MKSAIITVQILIFLPNALEVNYQSRKNWQQQLIKDQMGTKACLSFFPGLALMWHLEPHTHTYSLTTQPPTSQLAEQICSCLSSQYGSHTSSWLAYNKPTKAPSQPCQKVAALIFEHSHWVWFEWTPCLCTDCLSDLACKQKTKRCSIKKSLWII